MIEQILDTFVPADEALGMPSASRIDFAAYVQRYGIADVVARYGELLNRLAQEKQGSPFAELGEEARMAVVNASRTADIRLFSAFLTHVFRAYYSQREVLERIGGGAVPPFPDGNILPPDDWNALAAVYERGPVYRPVEE